MTATARRRRDAEEEQTQPIRCLPRNGDAFYRLSMDQQLLILAYLDDAPIPHVPFTSEVAQHLHIVGVAA